MFLIRIMSVGLTFHMLAKYFCPQQYNNFFVTSFTLVIYTYSFIELKFKNHVINNPHVKKILNFFERKHRDIEIIKSNSVCFSMALNEYNSWFNYNYNYDFTIYSHKNDEESTMYNRIIYHNVKNMLTNFSYEVCGYTFISIEVSIEDLIDTEKTNKYYLTLKENGENYYIVGNRINKMVIYYLLKQQHSVDYPDNTPYMIDLIDFNVNMKVLTEKDTLYLFETEYIIVRSEEEILDLENTETMNEDEYEVVDNDSTNEDMEVPDLIEIQRIEPEIKSQEEEIELEIEEMKKMTVKENPVVEKPKRKYNKRKVA